jgi:hypothetical protein
MFSVVGLAAVCSGQVIPPDQPVGGQSQLELANAWWPWAINVPIDDNPLLQSGDIGPVEGDQGNVFFLAGSTTSDPVVRNVTVPANKPLFFPLINQLAENTALPGEPPTTFTASELLDFISPGFDDATDLFLEIDGVPAANLTAHRQTTDPAEPFSYTTTSSDNLIDAQFGFDSTLNTGVYPSTVTPAVQDGFWVAVEGFANGTTHTLHFGGTGGSGFMQDLTYNLTVVPEPSTLGLVALGGCAAWIAIVRVRRRRDNRTG